MNAARISIVVLGILIPLLARLPGGPEWVKQYTDDGVDGLLFISAFNAPVWLGLLALTFIYRRPTSLLISCVVTFGFLAWAHFSGIWPPMHRLPSVSYSFRLWQSPP